MPPFLRLRRITPGREHWSVLDDQSESIGYILRHLEVPDGALAWTWSVGLFRRPRVYGRASSLDDAKAAVRQAWTELRAATSPAEYAAARDERRRSDEFVRFQDRPLKIAYAFGDAACARAEARIEELLGCLEDTAEAIELDQLLTLVEQWHAYVDGRAWASSRQEDDP